MASSVHLEANKNKYGRIVQQALLAEFLPESEIFVCKFMMYMSNVWTKENK